MAGLAGFSHGRTLRRQAPAGLSFGGPRSKFYIASLGWALKGPSPSEFHTAGPQLTGLARPLYGGPQPGFHITGPRQTFIRRALAGFQTVGHSRVFIQWAPVGHSYGGPSVGGPSFRMSGTSTLSSKNGMRRSRAWRHAGGLRRPSPPPRRTAAPPPY